MEEMIMMSGMSVSEIAEEVGMTRQAIDRHVPEHMRGRAPTFSTRFYEACLKNLVKAAPPAIRKLMNGMDSDNMSTTDEKGRELESKHPPQRLGGMYYTPKDLSCQVNIMIKGIDCKDRTKDTSDWCDNCKEKYIKIIDPASGSGDFLNDITKNPPFGKK